MRNKIENAEKSSDLLISLIFVGLGISFFLITPFFNDTFKLIFGAIFMISIGIISVIRESNISRSLGCIALFLGVLAFLPISIKFNETFGLFYFVFSFFILLILVYMVLINKSLLGIIIISFFPAYSAQTIFPIINDLLSGFFKHSFDPLKATALIMGLIFAFVSALIFIKYVISYFNEKIRHGSFNRLFSKINNWYFVIAITLILFISVIGFGFVRSFYIEDYPFKMEINEKGAIIGEVGSCISLQNSPYFKEFDEVSCQFDLSLPPNYTFLKNKTQVISSYGSDSFNISKDDYKINISLSHIYSINFNLGKNLRGNQFKIFYVDQNLSMYEVLIYYNKFRVLTAEEYEDRVKSRIFLLSTIISIILFSVFGAISSLKSILENNKPQENPKKSEDFEDNNKIKPENQTFKSSILQDSMKIRIAKKRDLDDLSNVEMSSGYHKNRFNFRPTLEELFKRKSIIFCAEDNSIIVGYISLAKNGEIPFLAVSKEFQGKGIASKLIEKVMYKAENMKIKKLFLDVKEDNFGAIKLYSKYGFHINSVNKRKIKGIEVRKLRMELVLK